MFDDAQRCEQSMVVGNRVSCMSRDILSASLPSPLRGRGGEGEVGW